MSTSPIRNRFETEAIRLRPILMRIALSITGNGDDAADIAQETLLKLWFLRDKLDGYSCLDAPARVIVRNLSLNTLRKRRSTQNIDDDKLPDLIYTEYEEPELPEEIINAINLLPDTEQAVLRLKHLEGMETEEIARLINSTPGAVRTALSRGRERIRRLYERKTYQK